MPRRDPCAVYPLHAMLTADPMGAGLPGIMPADPAGLDALAKRLDVVADRASEMSRAAKAHAEDCRSAANRIRRADAVIQSVEAKIARGELCGIAWKRAPAMACDDWHVTQISSDAHFVVNLGFGRTCAYSIRRSGLPADRNFTERGQIDVSATLALWRAFCDARKEAT